MTKVEKKEILVKFQQWFKEDLIVKHKNNTLKLKDVNEFKINPFLLKYLSNFLEGNSSDKSMAKVLVYARVLGPSINTTFGTSIQAFISKVLEGFGSTTSGIDIEFIDQLDKRKKYCQLKSGPDAINSDDVITIVNHFKELKSRARTNNLNLQTNDMIFCLIYGEENEKNSFIKALEKKHDVTVHVGREFWYHFTGDPDFYGDLIGSIDKVAAEVNMKHVIDEVIDVLKIQVEKKFDQISGKLEETAIVAEEDETKKYGFKKSKKMRFKGIRESNKSTNK